MSYANLHRRHADIIQLAVDKALFYALFICFGVALLLAVTNGWSRGSTLAYALGWAFFGVAIVCVEFGSVKRAVSEAKAGNKGMAWLCGGVGLTALILSTASTFNSAAVNIDRMQSMQLTKADAYENSKAEANSAGAEVLALRKSRDDLAAAILSATPKVGGRDVVSEEAARQLIQAAKADRYWKRSEGCTDTKGRDTSKFCLEYREAEAAIPALQKRAAMEDELAKVKGELAAAEGKHNEASKAAANAPAVVDKRTPFVRMMVNYGGIPEDVAPAIDAGLPSLGLQIMLMLLGLIVSGTAIVERLDDGPAPAATPSGPGPSTRAAYGGRLHPQRVVERHVVERQPFVVAPQTEFDPFQSAMERLSGKAQASSPMAAAA